jgi:outer membrane protein
MRRILFAAAVLATAATPAFAQQPTQPALSPVPQPAAPQGPTALQQELQGIRRVSLDEAIQLSVQGQPAMIQARQDVRVANAQERQASAAFLPSVTATANTSRSGGSRSSQFGIPTTVESFYSSNLRLAANWDLFTGFRRGAQRNAAGAASDQRDATLRRSEFATVLATKQTFFQALAFAELVNVQETRLRSADEQLKLTSERLRLGATTRSDSLRARVEYGNAQLALIDAINNLRNAQANLGRAVQVSGLVMASYDSSLEARVATLDTAVLTHEALASAPSIREADATVENSRAQKNVARAAWMPTLSLGASNTWLAGNNTINIRDTSGAIVNTIEPTGNPFGGRYLSGWNFSLTASYPLFNNLSRETNSITSDAAFQANVARARDARLQLTTNLTQAYASLDAAAARIQVSTISVAAATEDLRMQRERYRLGAVTIIEVLASQGNLDQAQVDLVQARYDYLVARAQIEALVGHGL